jgi:hypothetical protein
MPAGRRFITVERHEHLEECRKHDALLRFLRAFCRQRALDDVLVEAPVGEIHDPHAADEHGYSRQADIVRRIPGKNQVEAFWRLLEQYLEAGDDALPARYFVQRNDRDQNTAEEKQRDLDDVGQGHGLEAAIQ